MRDTTEKQAIKQRVFKWWSWNNPTINFANWMTILGYLFHRWRRLWRRISVSQMTIPIVVITIFVYPTLTYRIRMYIKGFVLLLTIRQVYYVEQDRLALPDHLISPLGFYGVRIKTNTLIQCFNFCIDIPLEKVDTYVCFIHCNVSLCFYLQ